MQCMHREFLAWLCMQQQDSPENLHDICVNHSFSLKFRTKWPMFKMSLDFLFFWTLFVNKNVRDEYFTNASASIKLHYDKRFLKSI